MHADNDGTLVATPESFRSATIQLGITGTDSDRLGNALLRTTPGRLVLALAQQFVLLRWFRVRNDPFMEGS